MKRKNQNNKKKRRSYLKYFVLFFCIYCTWNIISTQVAIKRQSAVLEAVKIKCNNQLSDNEEYMNIVKLESNEQYIKRVAREKLGFIEPDERVFIDISSK